MIYVLILTTVDFKRVFGIALSYISHTIVSSRKEDKIEQKPTAQTILNHYIVNIAYSSLARWFKNLKHTERKKFVSFIMSYLRQNRSSSDSSDEDIDMVLDILAQNKFADNLPKTTLEEPSDLDLSGEPRNAETWLVGNSLVRLENIPNYGPDFYSVTIKRSSGVLEFKIALEAEESASSSSESIGELSSATLPEVTVKRSRSISHGSRAMSDFHYPASLGRRKTMSSSASLQEITSSLLSDREKRIFHSIARKIPFPDWNFVSHPPIRIPESNDPDDFYTRAVSVLDRIPVVDLHKVGVVYVGPGQTTEAEILSNRSGSPAYERFLESLGMSISC